MQNILQGKFLKIQLPAALIICLGLVLRFRQYFQNNSLWLDEAMLALNIVNRSFAGLLRPLEYDQGAPIFFLWAEKLAQITLGNNEYSLRLLALLAGCLSLMLFWQLAHSLILPGDGVSFPMGAIFALVMLACGRYFVFYGAQLKQYSLDVCITLLIYVVGLRFLKQEPGQKEYWLLGLLGALATWSSHTAVFSLAAFGLVWLGLRFKDIRSSGWRANLPLALVLIFWLINVAGLYMIQFSSLTANEVLTGYWSEFFMPLTTAAPGWFVKQVSGLLFFPGELLLPGIEPLMALICLIGFGSLLLRKVRWAWLFGLTVILVLAASGLGKYPFGGRMAMFLIPGLLICTGEGLVVTGRMFRSGQKLGLVFTVLLAAGMAFSPVTTAVEQLIKPKVGENIAGTMAYLKTNYREGDVLYLYRMSIPAFRYYAPKYRLEAAQVFEGGDFHLDRGGYFQEVELLAQNKRVWFLFSHMVDPEYEDDQDAIMGQADVFGKKKREFSEPGTSINLYLYQFGQ